MNKPINLEIKDWVLIEKILRLLETIVLMGIFLGASKICPQHSFKWLNGKYLLRTLKRILYIFKSSTNAQYSKNVHFGHTGWKFGICKLFELFVSFNTTSIYSISFIGKTIVSIVFSLNPYRSNNKRYNKKKKSNYKLQPNESTRCTGIFSLNLPLWAWPKIV